MGLRLVLLVGALVCFGLATFGVPVRGNLVAAGLFLWALAQVI